MRVVDLITKKRNGIPLTKEEIAFLINGYVEEKIPDYQIAAWLMAIYFQPLTEAETNYLTEIMLHSGETIDLSPINGIKVDKHSTGGVGDKTSLVVASIASALGVKMAKMSGRGLGHTGGTLDKLESIPGFKIEITPEQFYQQVNEIGLAIIGQSINITPADKKLYALRDVTSTVESIGLIAASIMSKKLASGADHIVLDVKVGNGAFMKDLSTATQLAKAMVKIGESANRDTIALLTDMEQPLGNMVGNALEVIEAIETLKGNGPDDFTQLCYAITTEILIVAKIAKNHDQAKELIDQVISNHQALDKFRAMIKYQGGNPLVIDDYLLLPQAQNIIEVKYQNDLPQYVKAINALEIGEAARILGAGRATKEDKIDYAVGIKVNKKIGDLVTKEDVIAYLYVNSNDIESVIKMVEDSYQYSKEPVNKRPIVLDIIRKEK